MSPRLKVLIVTAWYPSEAIPAGGIFVQEQALAVSRNADVSVAVLEVDETGRTEAPTVSRSVEADLLTIRHRQGRGGIGRIRYIVRTWREVRFLRELIAEVSPDVVHVHHYTPAVPTAIACRKLEVPFIVTEHWSGFFLGTVRGVELLKAKFAFRRAEMITAVSRFLRERLKEHGVRTRIEVVSNPVNTDLFRPCADRQAFDPAHPKIIAVGRMAPVKGMIYLVEALELLTRRGKKFSAIIAGDGPEFETIKRKVGDSGSGESIILTGPLPKEEIARLFGYADFIVSPSLGETQGVAIAEALAAGLPVVATSVGAVPDLVNESNGILVKPADATALADGIERMIAGYQRFDRAKIGDVVRREMNFDAVGGRYLEFYREVASKTTISEYTSQP